MQGKVVVRGSVVVWGGVRQGDDVMQQGDGKKRRQCEGTIQGDEVQ